MFKIFGKRKFPVTIFIIASLANLIILSLLFFFFKINFNYNNNLLNDNSAGRYYNYQRGGDPLITKVPRLSDILAGPIVQASDPSLGPDDAKIVITYFSDYACGYCGEQEETLKQILDEYEGRVRLTWKDYPEIDNNSMSWQAAIAARCAQAQGRFWEYHDLLYGENIDFSFKEDQSSAESIDFFISLAGEINLDRDLFRECLQNEITTQLVLDNILEARALDINGIPFIYINNQEVMGEMGLEDLRRIIEIELNKKVDKK